MTATVELAFRTPDGRRQRVKAGLRPQPVSEPSQLTSRRAVLLDQAGWCLQVRAVTDRPAALDLLAAQVAAALRVHHAFAGSEAAALFPDLIGYDLDAAEPFALYQPPRGKQVAGRSGWSSTELRIVGRDLVRSVQLLETLDLVHQGINPGTVRWDGRTVQLWGLDTVTHLGRPRRSDGKPPYVSPELRRGEGTADPRDALWSCAQVMYHLLTNRHGDPDRPPADLAEYRSLQQTLGPAFAARAAERPSPAELLRRLDPVAPTAGRSSEELAPDRAEFDRVLALKRAAPSTPPAAPEQGSVRCPYCLEPIWFDPDALFSTDERQNLVPLDLSALTNELRRPDQLNTAFQRCHGDPGFPEHHIPVPYLTNGRPLTVAMVGETSSGKSHLLTQMIAEITDNRLEPYGVRWQPVNREQTARFARQRVAPLRGGAVLGHTGYAGSHAEFVEALLLTDARGRTRPVAFFDLGGEDLTRTDGLLSFLLGVDALLFVVDPALALPFAQLDEIREETRIEVQRAGDVTFATVLNRLPRPGSYLDVPAAVVLAKADLLRLEPPVDRWLDAPPQAPLDLDRLREESRDVYALLHRHAGKAWLRPFDTLLRCTLHIASATGGRQQDGRYPRQVRAQRVLEPLISVLAMHGMIQPAGGASAAEVGR
ncbi:protein kinase family protein [Kitasatospora azatica]|uniref:hypothetical protein n=1 Tax=Kitasatospora azatica TaxID=58347 RepID=UPI000ABEC009|nr:hypothetical protein [Kitasatospora azatica]